MKSIERLTVLAMALLIDGIALGQNTSKEINVIKRNQNYLYAEATMETEAEARNVATELLMQEIRDYIASKRSLSAADNVLIKDMKSSAEVMTMMRGDMHRVFVYVKKSSIEGVSNTTIVNAGSGATITVSGGNDAIVDVQGVGYDNNYTEPTPVPVPTPASTSVAQPKTAAQPTEQPSDNLSRKIVDKTPAQAEPTPKPEPKAAANTTGDKVESPLPTWQQQAMNALLDCADITAVRAQLNRMKAEYKVKRYGTPDKCTSPDKAFWVVYDNAGKVVTILGQGAAERVDYRTMTYSSLDNYKGMNMLWFTFSN